MNVVDDRDAGWFRSMYARHYPDVVRYGLRRLNADAGPAAAEELAQEVFLIAWRRRRGRRRGTPVAYDDVMRPLPSTDDLLRVMTILGIPGDPLLIMKDHADERRRAELLAHITAALVGRQRAIEELAGLDVEDQADLHWRADREAAGAGQGTVELQLARLAWVQQSIVRERGTRPDLLADTVSTTVGALIQLLAHRPESPMLADAELRLRDAADHLANVVRSAPYPPI